MIAEENTTATPHYHITLLPTRVCTAAHLSSADTSLTIARYRLALGHMGDRWAFAGYIRIWNFDWTRIGLTSIQRTGPGRIGWLA